MTRKSVVARWLPLWLPGATVPVATEVAVLFLPAQKMCSSERVRLSGEGGRHSSVLHTLKVSQQHSEADKLKTDPEKLRNNNNLYS